MKENIDLLNEAFAAHEHLAPNPADVLERANEIARSYRRRRRVAKAAGASVLGAGIVAGGVGLPGRHWGSGPTEGITAAQTSSGNTLSIVPTTSATFTRQQELNAYFAAGYDSDNAADLAKLWHETNLAKVKADAGLKLLQGEQLPVTPNQAPETPQEKAVAAFFTAGYDSDDAVTLSKLWNETDLSQVKAEAGQKLLDGQTLPIEPSDTPDVAASISAGSPQDDGPAVADAKPNPALIAYFDAGYNGADAVELAKLWHQTDILKVKAEAGQKLLDGETLPIAP